jgi:hypothetical protein
MARLVVAAFADTTEATRGWGSVPRRKTERVVFCASVKTGRKTEATRMRFKDRILTGKACFRECRTKRIT